MKNNKSVEGQYNSTPCNLIRLYITGYKATHFFWFVVFYVVGVQIPQMGKIIHIIFNASLKNFRLLEIYDQNVQSERPNNQFCTNPKKRCVAL